MNRHSEIISTGPVSIETYVAGDGNGPDVVVLPSYGRDGGKDFDAFSAALSEPTTASCGPSRAARPARQAR